MTKEETVNIIIILNPQMSVLIKNLVKNVLVIDLNYMENAKEINVDLFTLEILK